MGLGLKVKTESNPGKYLFICLFKGFYACLKNGNLTFEMVSEGEWMLPLSS